MPSKNGLPFSRRKLDNFYIGQGKYTEDSGIPQHINRHYSAYDIVPGSLFVDVSGTLSEDFGL